MRFDEVGRREVTALGKVFTDRVINRRDEPSIDRQHPVERGLFHRGRFDATGRECRFHRAVRHLHEFDAARGDAVLIEPCARCDLADAAERRDGDRLSDEILGILNRRRTRDHEARRRYRARIRAAGADVDEVQPAFVCESDRQRVRRARIERSRRDRGCNRGAVRHRNQLDVQPGFLEEALVGGVERECPDFDRRGSDTQMIRLLRHAGRRREGEAEHAHGDGTQEPPIDHLRGFRPAAERYMPCLASLKTPT